jgi:hypothetical protein
VEVVFLSSRIDRSIPYNGRAQCKPDSRALELLGSYETASPRRRHNGGRLAFVGMVQEKFPARRRPRFSSGQRADIFEMVSMNFMLRSIGLLYRPPVAASLQSPETRTKVFWIVIDTSSENYFVHVSTKNMPARNMLGRSTKEL